MGTRGIRVSSGCRVVPRLSRKLVSGKSLHDAVVALGLTRYSVEDTCDFWVVVRHVMVGALRIREGFCGILCYVIGNHQNGVDSYVGPCSLQYLSGFTEAFEDLTRSRATPRARPVGSRPS